MKNFDDKIPSRDFDNFQVLVLVAKTQMYNIPIIWMKYNFVFLSSVQFVNFTEIMSKNKTPVEKETAFALAALMEIPLQYKAVMELGILG